jgi:hypothetical protein
MKIAVAGGSGLIGRHFIAYAQHQGHQVTVISRSKNRRLPFHAEIVTWEELARNSGPLNGTEAIVNLAGESINQRWTHEAKRRILNSRVETAQAIADLVRRMEQKPAVVVNASGISYYGTSESETFDESSPCRITDFLAEVTAKWEEAIDRIADTRVVKLRVSLVLAGDGGALPKMALPYKLGVGGRVGSGKQWMSWIHISDMVRLIDFCIQHPEMSGPVNASSPHPVTNDEFGRTLGQALGRPHYFPVPAWLMKLVFGELSVLLLQGQKAIPAKASAHGFSFRFPAIKDALQDLYRK